MGEFIIIGDFEYLKRDIGNGKIKLVKIKFCDLYKSLIEMGISKRMMTLIDNGYRINGGYVIYPNMLPPNYKHIIIEGIPCAILRSSVDL